MKLKELAKQMKSNVGTLYFAYLDKRTPLFAKIMAIIVVGYAMSPIDLIPDFIPVLGYLDDVILLPFGIWLTLKLIPKEIVEQSKIKAEQYFAQVNPSYIWPIFFVISFWIALLVILYSVMSK